MEMPGREENEKGLLILRIIWTGMLGFLFFYLILGHQLADEIGRSASATLPLDLVRNTLYGIAILTLLLIHFLRRRMTAGRSDDSGPTSSSTSSISNQSSVLAKYMSATIVSLALSESIGIYGLALIFLGDNTQALHIFIGISALAIIFYRPRRGKLEALSIAGQRKETPTPEL